MCFISVTEIDEYKPAQKITRQLFVLFFNCVALLMADNEYRKKTTDKHYTTMTDIYSLTYKLPSKNDLVVQELEMFICRVDTKLFKAVGIESFKTKRI